MSHLFQTVPGTTLRRFWCPACQTPHLIDLRHHTIEPGRPLTVTGTPVMSHCRAASTRENMQCCRFRVIDGYLEYEPECWHSLAGQRARIPVWNHS